MLKKHFQLLIQDKNEKLQKLKEKQQKFLNDALKGAVEYNKINNL